MTKETEEKIIELYEKVATMQITPNKARKAFVALFQDEQIKLLNKFHEIITNSAIEGANDKTKMKGVMLYTRILMKLEELRLGVKYD